MKPDQFRVFLRTSQKVSASSGFDRLVPFLLVSVINIRGILQSSLSDLEIDLLFNKYGDNGFITQETFLAFLSSSDNSAIDAKLRQIYQDMTKPLPDYYISSSHNTYLLGSQWKGESTVEGYIRALLSGCRSVESEFYLYLIGKNVLLTFTIPVDCYDGIPEPVIYHGNTFTGAVPVREVCLAIAGYAFMASPYPVIISAEVHCNLEQQVILAKILRETCGSALITQQMEDDNLAEGILPSPEQLKYRILFKSKRPMDPTSSPGLSDSASNNPFSSSPETESTESDTNLSSKSFRRRFGRLSGTFSRQNDSDAAVTPANAQRRPDRSYPIDSAALSTESSTPNLLRQNTLKAVVVAPVLASLMIYAAGIKYRGFSKLNVYKPADMFSVSEKTARKIAKESPLDFIKHNRTHLSRVYPVGTRLTSTNYLPHEYWALGCQLVALNWQTSDLGYLINCAMFARNGRCGYVLKPEVLRTKAKEGLKKRNVYRMSLDVSIQSK